jgi:centrin-1
MSDLRSKPSGYEAKRNYSGLPSGAGPVAVSLLAPQASSSVAAAAAAPSSMQPALRPTGLPAGFGRMRAKPKPKKDELSQEEMEEIREAFDLFDTNKSGSIDVREVRASMRALGFEVKKEEMRQMLDTIGKEATAMIDFQDFVRMVSGKMSTRDSREEIQKVFKLFDDSGAGFITFRNLKRVCQELGENIGDDEIQEMIDEADRNGDGQVTFDDFFRIMKKKSDNPLDDWSSDEE